MRFVDTNVLLYAVQHTLGEASSLSAAKRRNVIAGRSDLAVSVQVFQEFYSPGDAPRARPIQAERTDDADGLPEELS